MKKQTFLKGALTVSVGGALAKVLGAFYRIPLANALGGEGLGLYQMTYPLYCLLLTLAATGVPAGLARAVARAEAAGDGARSQALLRRALGLFTAVGLAASALMFLLAPVMAAVQGAPAAASAYRALAPSVALVAALSCFRGWFQGRGNFLPTALSEVLEQAVKIAFGLFFARLFAGDVPRAVAYTLFAVTLSEGAAVLFMLFCAAGQLRGRAAFFARPALSRGGRGAFAGRGGALARGLLRGGEPLFAAAGPSAAGLLRSVLPAAAAAGILPLSNIVDSILIVRLVGRYAADATALYGLYAGGAAALTNLPVSLCYGLAAAGVPALAALCARGRAAEAEKRALFAVKCTLFIALPAAAFLFCYPSQLALFLFRSLAGAERAVLARLVRASALSSVFLALTQTLSGCLTGMGKAKTAAGAMTLAVSVKLILECVLLRVPQISVLGAAYAAAACFLVALSADFVYSIRERANRVRAGGYFLRFSLAAAACAAAAWPLRGAHVLVIFAVSAAVYLLLALAFGAFTAEELRLFQRRKGHDHPRRIGL